MHSISGTKRNLNHEKSVKESMQVCNDPRHNHQKDTESRPHDHSVVQRAADGSVTVIGHHTQEESIHVDESDEEVDLGHTFFVRDRLASQCVIHQCLGDCDWWKTDVDAGEIGQEEVHGCMEIPVTADSQDDEKVPDDSDQVDPREQPKKSLFLLWLPRQSQKKEFCDFCLVAPVHVCREENMVKSKRKDLIVIFLKIADPKFISQLILLQK